MKHRRKPSRFQSLAHKLALRGAYNPEALAAWIGRRKYGPQKFAQMARRGR